MIPAAADKQVDIRTEKISRQVVFVFPAFVVSDKCDGRRIGNGMRINQSGRQACRCGPLEDRPERLFVGSHADHTVIGFCAGGQGGGCRCGIGHFARSGESRLQADALGASER